MTRVLHRHHPDSVAVGGQGEPDIAHGIPALPAAGDVPELHPWDHYFDEQQDVELEDRGGTFRHAAQACSLPNAG